MHIDMARRRMREEESLRGDEAARQSSTVDECISTVLSHRMREEESLRGDEAAQHSSTELKNAHRQCPAVECERKRACEVTKQLDRAQQLKNAYRQCPAFECERKRVWNGE